MKRISLFAAAAAMLLLAGSCNNAPKSAEETQEEVQQTEELLTEEAQTEEALAEEAQPEKEVTIPEEPVYDIITNMGTIKVKLYSGTPKHRENFIKLASEGFYDGTKFHRVIDGFMIQGGDPNSKDTVAVWGEGGPGYTIPAEFREEYTHKKGALAAARMGDVANPMKESSGSQFYLVQDPNNCKHLDGEYTVYGETVEGLDVIDRIASVQTGHWDRPLNDVVIKKVMLDPDLN